MELRNNVDLPILQRCYSTFPALSPHWLDFRREMDSTNDKDLFLEEAAPALLPLFEGKMIWQYSHVFDKPQYWLDQPAFDQRLHSKELYRMAQDLGVNKETVEQHAASVSSDRTHICLCYRKIARDTDERTLIFSLLPRQCGFVDSLYANIPKTYVLDDGGVVQYAAVSALRLLFGLAWFNSVPMDWLARFMVQINVPPAHVIPAQAAIKNVAKRKRDASRIMLFAALFVHRRRAASRRHPAFSAPAWPAASLCGF